MDLDNIEGKVHVPKDPEPLVRQMVVEKDKSISANGGKGPPAAAAAAPKASDAGGARQQDLLADDNPAQIHAEPEEEATSQPAASEQSDNSRVKFSPACEVKAKDVTSAIRRAKTAQCKQQIADVFCLQEEGKLYNLKLPNFCPNKRTDGGHYYGCYRDSGSQRDLEGGMEQLDDNSPQACVNHCYRSGMRYAGLQFTKECWCGNQFGRHGARLDEAHCHSRCPGNASETCGAYLSNRVFGTGVQEMKRVEAPLQHPAVDKAEPRVKIVFVLTVNGRAVRQVARLLRVIYSPDHFYYIHVDKRQEFLYRELLPLQDRLSNVMLTSKRFSTIWGGASLLQAHLTFLSELFLERPAWNWDYYINLSESDYPVKSVTDLTEYLTAYKGISYLRSSGKNVPRFIKKQGMDQTFHECENHLWRVGPRPLPYGIVFDGGSDWVGLWREFAHYAVFSQDELVLGLKQYYKYSLLPVE
ncbi:xylosyltransferase oxt, partial [Plakobranchus ocellatus]